MSSHRSRGYSRGSQASHSSQASQASLILTNDDLKRITEQYLKRFEVDTKITENLAQAYNKCPELLRQKRPVISPSSASKYTKKAIVIVGAAGSGKSYVQRYLFSKVPDFQYYLYNPDTYSEILMEEYRILQRNEAGEGIPVSPKKQKVLELVVRDVVGIPEGHDTEIQGAITYWKSRSMRWFLSFGQLCSMEDFKRLTTKGTPIVIDRTGDTTYSKSSNSMSVMEQIKYLKRLGYSVYLLAVYSPLNTVLERNAKRARNLEDDVVKKIWHNLFGTRSTVLEEYREELGKEHMMVLNNSESRSPLKFETHTLDEVREQFIKWMTPSPKQV